MVSKKEFKICMLDMVKYTKTYVDKHKTNIYPIVGILLFVLGLNINILHKIESIYKSNISKSVVNKQKLVTINLDVFQVTGRYMRGKTECTKYRLIGKVEQYYTECVRIK